MLKFGNDVLKVDTSWIDYHPEPDPYNPLNLPPNTIRVRWTDGMVPETPLATTTMVQVSSEPNIWDITCNTPYIPDRNYVSWNYLFDPGSYGGGMNTSYLKEVLGANSSNVRSMAHMFLSCDRLESVALFDTRNLGVMTEMFMDCDWVESLPLFDTSSVYNMDKAFANMSHLKNIPLFDTSYVHYANNTFSGCSRVESGALAMYNQMSSQANPPVAHEDTFHLCGWFTTTGAAELAQIPTSWGGRLE